MGKLRGFKEYLRTDENSIDPKRRTANYKEFTKHPGDQKLREEGARCMDCGIPFCHSGCPLGNLIPDFNDAVYRNDWQRALTILHSTNNFPEFTGRLCPAPCEESCVLGIIDPPVSIEMIEKYIAERGFKEGWIKPDPPIERTGKKIAIIGSGPAGLAAAQQLNFAGHDVTVYEKDNKIGGLLRYGIPDFKMEKSVIDRRLEILIAEGIEFQCNQHVGVSIDIEEILMTHDALLLAIGAGIRRSLPIPGHHLKGVIQAMDYLPHNNQFVDGQIDLKAKYNATDRHVIVIGGGDTGSDCIGTANRQKAKSVTNFEIMPKPTLHRTKENPWPYWPFTLSASSSHKEGVDRNWSIMTKEFIGDESKHVRKLKTVEVEWRKDEFGVHHLVEKPHTEKLWPCDMALLALGFTGPQKNLAEQLNLPLDQHGNFQTTDFQTQNSKIFVAGDARRGQSLIVWAISEGRDAAHYIDRFLMNRTNLPLKNHYGDLLTPKAG
ncbi:MAG: glutamate synthase subunit beta [Flavobacteriaceae bacterium]|nr:glutamate synthase subunit beta [Flavobacteriaceae bacterium]MCY4268124.1 glutamate synthase subunit beta [Flavobacteriaceae bacterium]